MIPSITWERRKQADTLVTETENLGIATEEWNKNRKILTCSLTIKFATASDAGFYNCILRKKTEHLKSADMKINVVRSKIYIFICHCMVDVNTSDLKFTNKSVVMK